MPTGLRLALVTQDNVRAACKLTMRPDQEDLVAPVAWSLADAYTMPDIAWPRLIYNGDRRDHTTPAEALRLHGLDQEDMKGHSRNTPEPRTMMAASACSSGAPVTVNAAPV